MSFRLSLISALALAAALPAAAEPVFNRIASFPTNMAEGEDKARASSAEIITATEDGNTLIYSDSPLGVIGLIDITDPKAPKPLGNIDMEGEPTTTVVIGDRAFVGVNTSESFTEPSGALRTVDIAGKAVTESCDLGGQPDSVARSADGTFIAVAIENERDEEVNDGALPQMPAGFVVKLPVVDGVADCAAMQRIEVTGLAATAGDDPEPEFIAINDDGVIAVTLQENNEVVLIGADGAVSGHFSAGAVDLIDIDTEDDGKLDFTASAEGVLREPDSIAWIDSETLVTANEGDWQGGSRGFTIWRTDGTVLYEDAGRLEKAIVAAGHYPDGRSDNKGAELESVAVADYDGAKLLFVASERASIIGVYDIADPAAPVLEQLLPSGVSPEGMVAITARNLFATANEADLGEDNGPRAHVMIYERAEGTPAYPTLTAEGADSLIGWGALSGLTVDPETPTTLHAVSDSVFDAMPSIYTIDTTQTPARITAQTVVTQDGATAEKLDLEGIASDGAGGFWLASEGDPAKEIPHRVLHVDAAGAVTREIPLPEALAAGATRFSLEGVTVAADGALWLAVQREWEGDPKDQVKLLRLDPAAGEWTAVRYPLEAAGAGWVGLSEIAAHGDWLYLLERDNQTGDAAVLKQVTRVRLADLAPVPLDAGEAQAANGAVAEVTQVALAAPTADLPLAAKEVVRDLIPDLKQWNGYVAEKVEGLAIAPDGTAWVVTDNDGTDDSSGETFLWSFKVE